MYDIYNFNGFIADRVRTDAYAAALTAVLRPGDTVLDLGAGTGFFSVLACKLGAAKVYAVDYNDALQLGHELAQANGCTGRIEFIHNLSTRVELPEAVDVVVSDLRGRMVWYGQGVNSIIDARSRFLKPGGVLIPQRDEVHACVVELPDAYHERIAKLVEASHEIDQTPARRYLVNTWFHADVTTDDLLTESALWATLDYATVIEPNVGGELKFVAKRTGVAHGFSIWFRGILSPGVEFTTEPGGPSLVYGNPFFPFEAPVNLDEGDEITINLRGDLTGEEYEWSWETQVTSAGNDKAFFRQSTFLGQVISLDRLRKRSAMHTPQLNADGDIDLAILSLMNGRVSLDAIASEITRRFPDRFRSWNEALAHVGELAVKYS